MLVVGVQQDSVSTEERALDSQPCFLRSPNFLPQRMKMQTDADARSYSELAVCQPITSSSSLVPRGYTSCLWASVTMRL